MDQGFPIPLAPIREQAELFRLIEEGLDLVESVIQLQSSSRFALAQLDQSILAKAFRGELVPQDPSDEPASVLLERIRQTRSQAKTAIKRSRSAGNQRTS